MAIAIALHNIPEGIAIAVPTYYATGSRMKAFLYVSVAAITQPIAALVTWGILGDQVSSTTFGVLFGFVGGIMMHTSLKELLPTAFSYDPKNRVVTKFLLLGMVIMAGTLVALHYLE